MASAWDFHRKCKFDVWWPWKIFIDVSFRGHQHLRISNGALWAEPRHGLDDQVFAPTSKKPVAAVELSGLAHGWLQTQKSYGIIIYKSGVLNDLDCSQMLAEHTVAYCSYTSRDSKIQIQAMDYWDYARWWCTNLKNHWDHQVVLCKNAILSCFIMFYHYFINVSYCLDPPWQMLHMTLRSLSLARRRYGIHHGAANRVLMGTVGWLGLEPRWALSMWRRTVLLWSGPSEFRECHQASLARRPLFGAQHGTYHQAVRLWLLWNHMKSQHVADVCWYMYSD